MYRLALAQLEDACDEAGKAEYSEWQWMITSVCYTVYGESLENLIKSPFHKVASFSETQSVGLISDHFICSVYDVRCHWFLCWKWQWRANRGADFFSCCRPGLSEPTVGRFLFFFLLPFIYLFFLSLCSITPQKMKSFWRLLYLLNDYLERETALQCNLSWLSSQPSGFFFHRKKNLKRNNN